MKRIDAHMHITQLQLADGRSVFDALRQYQRENEIESVDIMCCSNQGNLWKSYEPDQAIVAAITKMEVPSTYIHGCMYIPDGELPEEFNFVSQLEELRAIGFDGVKSCEYKPDSYKLHHMDKRGEEFEAYFTWCEKNSFPVCMHVADPDTFWDASRTPQFAINSGWFYGDGTFPTYDSLYEQTYAILERHPNMHLMLAHAFFLSNHPEKIRALFRKYPRVTIDLAPGWEMFDGFRLYHDQWSEIFRTYSDRILYATDATISAKSEYANRIAENVHRFLTDDSVFEVPCNYTAWGIALEEEHAEKILYSNIKRIVGNSPREIDRHLLRDYIRKYLPLLPDSRNKCIIEEYYHKNLL